MATEPLTLARALEIAHQNNPELLAARQEVEVARGQLVKARYWNQANPDVGGQGNHRSIASGGGATDFAVAVSQELEVAGQRTQRIEEAERTAARVAAQVRDRERLLDAAVKRAFFGALAAQQRLSLQRTIEDLNRRVRDAATARVQAGESPAMEANLAEIRYGQSRKETLAAAAAQATALLALHRLLGLPSERAIEPTGELRGPAKDVTLQAAVQAALTQRPDLAAAAAEVKRVAAESALTRRVRIPNPTVEVFYQTETDSAAGADRIAGAGLRIPLPVFDRKQGELVALAAQENQARQLTESTRQTIEQEVAAGLHQYDAVRRTLDVFEHDVLGRVEETFHFIESAYRAGKIDLLQFIVVQNDLVAAQLSYLDSLATFREAEVNLEQAIGGAL